MPGDDLLDHAKSDQDFYALLGEGIHPGSADNDIRRAYRRTALKHHPDKNKDDAGAVDKFHALQIAFDVLSDPGAKAAYDNARLAREAKKRQTNMFEGRRRTMMEDLERRESGAFKRKRDEMEAEEILERELRRLQEDGRRRRLEREEALRKEVGGDDDEEMHTGEIEKPSKSSQNGTRNGGTNVPEIQRTVKVRWLKDGAGENLDKERLLQMFSSFGKVENALIMKDRKVRLGENQKKKLVGNGVIVFVSVVGAHAAVEDSKKLSSDGWDAIESVEWAEGKEPDFAISSKPSTWPPQQTPQEDKAPAASTPKKTSSEERKAFPGLDSAPSTPFSAKSMNVTSKGDGLRKVPSFSSFASAKFGTPASSPFGKSVGSPSLEEITLIRLKNAEKKRLEEKIRREEAESAANGEGVTGETV